MKKLYCFDFDGTLTRKDTMFLFLKFYSPAKFRMQFLKHIPLFILLKLRLLKAERVKKSFIGSVLKGERKEVLHKKAQQFFERFHPDIFRVNALDFIKSIDRTHTDCMIVSASLDIWVQPFADYFKMTLLCTEAEFEDGRFTGNFATPNCNGEEKVRRIKAATNGKKYDKTLAFGDTSGDRPMLSWADEGQFKFFH